MRKFTKFFLSLMAMLMVTVSANAWKFASATPANESEVESLDRIVLNLPADAGWLHEFSATFNLTDQNGTVTQCNFSTMSAGIVDTDATFQKITTPGTYTLTIPAGSLHYMDANWAPAEANEAQTFTWTVKDSSTGGGTQGGGDQGGGSQTTGWSFTDVTPATGTTVESLKSFTFGLPSGINGLNTGGTGTLALPNGETKSVSIYDNFTSINGDILVDNPLTDAGTYTLTIPANAIEGSDGTKNAEMTFSWTIEGAAPAPTYTVSYADGTLKVTWPEGTTIEATDFLGSLHPTLEGYDGFVSAGVWGASNEIVSYITLAAGDYTLKFPAGDFTINGTPNAAISETFTVSGGTQGGGGGTFDGEPFHETIFEAGVTAVSIPYTVDNTNVSISTVGREFMGSTLEVGYNMNSEKELNWKNGTKFVITAKKDINKVIFVPTTDAKDAIAYASATGGDGEYNNGVWEGKLAAGETLTLTANDGINIKEFYICYNGDDFDPAAGGADEKGVITIQYPEENQAITKITDGGTLAKFTTNKQYAYVTVELRNVNDRYHNKYDLPMRYMDDLAAGEQTCTTSTPGTSSTGGNPAWIPYNGDAFELVIKGYVNPWDNDYDAMAVVHVRGESAKEHEPESNETLVKITPTTATELEMGAPKAKVTNLRDNVITFEFSGTISKFNAVRGGSLMAGLSELKLTTTPVDADRKVWTVTIPKDDIITNFNPGEDYNFEITAYDAENAVLLLNDSRADNALAVIFEVTDEDVSEDDVKTLGDLTFSVENYPDGVPASTTSILVTFPEAQGFSANVIAKVSGSLACMDMSTPVEFSNVEGTLADGVSVPVALADGKGYSFTITSVALSEKTTVEQETFINPIGTYNGSWNTQFNVGEEQGGGTGDNILGEATFTAGETGITVAWPNAQLDGTGADYISFGEWTLTHKGVDYVFYPEAIEADLSQTAIEVEIPYTKIAVYDPNVGDFGAYIPVELAAGDEITVTIPVEAINVYEGYNPAIYINAAPITGTVTVPGDEPQPQLPTSVIIYEEGVDTHTNNTELNFSKYDVTLTSETTGSTYAQNNFKPACSSNTSNHLRLFTYNTLKFAAERDIVKIEFVPVSQSAKWGAKSVSTGSFSENVWTGESKTVDLVLDGANMDVLKIIVTLAGDPEPEKVKATMSIGAAKWGTFVAPFEVTIPAGVTAYTVEGRNEGVLELEEVATTIPANTPVVVYSESSVAEEFEDVAVDGTPEAGMLVGVYDETQVAEGTYVLQNHDGVVGFYKVGDNSNKTVKANRCYLVDPSASAPAFFFTEEDATAINGINADVLGAEGIYNANGVRVNTLQKGLNIIKTANGTKKVMIK